MTLSDETNSITIKPINTKNSGQIFRCNYKQANILSKEPTKKILQTHPNLKMYSQESNLNNQLLNDDSKNECLSEKQKKNFFYIPPPPPMPKQNSLLLSNNTFTLKRNYKQNLLFQPNEPKSLNLFNNQRLNNNKINKLIQNMNLKNQVKTKNTSEVVSDEEESSLNIKNSTTSYDQDIQNQLDNSNFLSLPYHQNNFYQQNHETSLKFPISQNCSSDFQSYLNIKNDKNPKKILKNKSDYNTEELNFNNLASSLEDIRCEKITDDKNLDHSLTSVLRNSSERQRQFKEQLKNELSLKFKKKNQSFHDNYFLRKKPKYEFFSQLYFLVHLSLTICFLKISEIDKENNKLYGEIFNFYFGYLLATSTMFLLVLRCCKNPNYSGNKKFRSQITSILFGCITLGIIQLISVGLDFTQCISSDLLFLPILNFTFVFLVMHFILTQTKESNDYFYNNVAIAHLLLTQISIWLGHFKQKNSKCGYFENIPDIEKLTNKEDFFEKDMSETSNKNLIIKLFNNLTDNLNSMSLINTTQLPTQLKPISSAQIIINTKSSLSDLLMPIIHHYQILTIFILFSIWINNNKTKINYHRIRLNETESIFNCFNETELITNNFFDNHKKLDSIKGFFLGLLTISTTIVVLITKNDYYLIITHSVIQLICIIVIFFALLIKGRKKKGLQKLPDKYLDPSEYHLFVITSLIFSYFCSFSAIILNLTQKYLIMENLVDSCLLFLQITLQTILLRSDGRNLNKLRDIHAFLIFASFSLWILEITEIASINGSDYNFFNLNLLPQIIVSLNRFYSALIFIHFWKTK